MLKDTLHQDVISVSGIDIEVRTYGSGSPLFLLAGEEQQLRAMFFQPLTPGGSGGRCFGDCC